MSYKRISPQPVVEGGTGALTLTNHGVLLGAGTSAVSSVGPGSVSGVPLIAQGSSADPVFGIANVVGGGTGGGTFTAYSLITAGTTSTGSFQNVSGVGTSGQLLTSNGASALPTWQAAPASSISITGDTGGALIGNAFTFTGGTTGLTFAGAVSTETLGGTLVVSNGGTGRATLTNHGVLVGAGTGAITQLAVGTTGQVLTGVTGADPVWASPAASSISITGDSGGALTGNAFTFTGGTTGLTFAGAGSTETVGGDLNVAHGGTGNTTFTAYSVICAGTTATGAFQNVSGLGSSGNVLTSNGAGALPTWQAAASGGISRINGDIDYVTGSTVNITTDVTGSCYSGKSVFFEANSAGGTFLFLRMTDDELNTFVGQSAGVDQTVFSGGGNNTSVGYASMPSISGATTTGNSALGYTALQTFTGGNYNTAIGNASGNSLLTGQYNTFVGAATASAYTSSESSNILIGYNTAGTAAESHVLRIGVATGTGAGELSSAYIQGIASVSVSNKNYVTIDTTTGQLGSDSGPSGALAWSVITANQTAAVNNGYFCNKAGTLTLALPATSAVGDVIEVTNENTALGVQFTQASGQQILIGTTNTTSGATGTLTSSAVGDTLKIVCKTANTIWRVTSSWGNWTPA